MTTVMSARTASRSLKLTKPPPLKSQTSTECKTPTSESYSGKTSPVLISQAEGEVKKAIQTVLPNKDVHGVLSLSEDWQRTQENKISYLISRISANHHSPLEVLTLCETLKEYGYILEAVCKDSLDKWFNMIRELVLKETYPKHSKIHLLSILEHRATKWGSDGKQAPELVKIINKTFTVETQTDRLHKEVPKAVEKSSHYTQTLIDNSDYESGCLNTGDGMLYVIGETPDIVQKALKILNHELNKPSYSSVQEKKRLSLSDRESCDDECKDGSNRQTPSDASDSGFSEQQYAWELLDKLKVLSVSKSSNRTEDIHSELSGGFYRQDNYENSKSQHSSGVSDSGKRDSFSSFEEEGLGVQRSSSVEDRVDSLRVAETNDDVIVNRLGDQKHTDYKRSFSFSNREKSDRSNFQSLKEKDNIENKKMVSFQQQEEAESKIISPLTVDSNSNNKRGFDFSSSSRPSRERSFSSSSTEVRRNFDFSSQQRNRHASEKQDNGDYSASRIEVNRRPRGGFHGLKKSDNTEPYRNKNNYQRSFSDSSQTILDSQTLDELFHSLKMKLVHKGYKLPENSDVSDFRNRNRLPVNSRTLHFPDEDVIPSNGTVILVREPLTPSSDKKQIKLVDSCLTGSPSSAKGRRRMFDKFSKASISPVDGEEEDDVLVPSYTRDELLEFSTSDIAHQPPEQFSFLSKIFPQICKLEVSEYFDVAEYREFWDMYHDIMKKHF